ncbi:GNAT family N-acetyltransferase [Oceanicoccus sagamiensis]|uniref:N-acetyltransferase domain-containing protein n=1 Tax=Oceanicoccus sagamiensis TaxID=716816 RepID=A0A1X9NK65_9GAMM|nr:GNAT family N-acetyltransferase [Oceanicoccus sagamiensis]ARN76215.1 hypothetical protein BST96_20175 [Oceanicoccus sagamiensis]
MNIDSSIVEATPASSGLAALLAKAFADDPVMAYIIPQQQGRLQRIEGIMQLAIKTYRHSGLIETVAGRSAAVWQRPSPGEPSLLAVILNSLEAMVRLRGAVDRAQQVQRITAAARIAQPHWYLAIIGTDPACRGQWQGGASLASQLLLSVLKRCDQQQLPAYLESSNYHNLGFYRRFGFEVTQTLQLPDGPAMWAMVREPEAGQSSVAFYQ